MQNPQVVDTHAHVFRRDLPLAPDRRYAPAQDAELRTYLALLAAHGVTHGVLVQPSFLGTDNRFLLQCLRRAGKCVRGIAVLSPAAGPQTLKLLGWAGIVGIRLNLVGLPNLPDLTGAGWHALLRGVADRDWQVELHADGVALPALLTPLLTSGVKVVVDHFGRPDPSRGIECPGFRALLRAGETGRVWVKLSAPYRLGGGDAGTYARALLRALGPERLLWGSDWPWTQHEDGMAYGPTLTWLRQWIPREEPRAQILWETPARLFGFGTCWRASAGTGSTTRPTCWGA